MPSFIHFRHNQTCRYIFRHTFSTASKIYAAYQLIGSVKMPKFSIKVDGAKFLKMFLAKGANYPMNRPWIWTGNFQYVRGI